MKANPVVACPSLSKVRFWLVSPDQYPNTWQMIYIASISWMLACTRMPAYTAHSYIKGPDNYASNSNLHWWPYSNQTTIAHMQWMQHCNTYYRCSLSLNDLECRGGGERREILGLAWSHVSSEWAIEIQNHPRRCFKSHTGLAIAIPHHPLEYTWYAHFRCLSAFKGVKINYMSVRFRENPSSEAA